METYIILGKFTQKGIENIKDSPNRLEAATKAIEAAGGRFLGWYLTMGQYDFVLVAEAPNANITAALLLGTGMQGYVSTETLRAFTGDEFRAILAGLP